MKNKIIYLILLLLLSTATTPILAQEQCDTELTQVQIDYMNATREARENFKATRLKSNTTTIIPMVAHIVRDDDGSGGLSNAQLNIALVNLNEAFDQVGFEFELCEINYIDNTAYTYMKQSFAEDSEEYEMAHANRVDDKMNVFFIPSLRSGNGWSSFPSYKDEYDKDWTVVKSGRATTSTFAHEIGHWFNLYHTHQEGNNEAEHPDGSNCGSGVGDELCDTPADPKLSDDNVTPDCIYVGNETYASTSYAPDVSNFMAYGQKECRTFFSPEQIARMQESYEFERMSSLSACTTPLDCQITSISVSNTKTCNDNGTPDDLTDDYIRGLVSVYYLGKPNSGFLRMNIQGINGIKQTGVFEGNKHEFLHVKMPADGNAVSMTAYFTEADCSFTNDNVHRGANCYPCHAEPNCNPCDMGIIGFSGVSDCYNNHTSEWTDDFFKARIRISRENWPTSGNLDITGDVQLSIPVYQLNNDDEYHDLPFTTFPANGQPITLTATFSEDGCTTTGTIGAQYPCSSDCDNRADVTSPVTGYYFKEAHGFIIANSEIRSGADATLNAGGYIKLYQGFHAQSGSKFHAYIDGCPNSAVNKEEPLVSELDATLGYLRNYPNPFTGQTTIEFVLTKDTPVTLFVSDVSGKQVAILLNNDEKPQGTHSITFDGNNYPAGMYYYTIQAGELYGTQKMILAK